MNPILLVKSISMRETTPPPPILWIPQGLESSLGPCLAHETPPGTILFKRGLCPTHPRRVTSMRTEHTKQTKTPGSVTISQMMVERISAL